MKTFELNTINIPKKSIESLMEALRLFEITQNEIEDFLILNNKNLIKKIKNARKEHKKGLVKNFDTLVKQYV